MIPNLIDFFSSYGSYHNNNINKLIHLICIPLITLTLFGLLQFITFKPEYLANSYFEFNFQFFFLTALILVYIRIDMISGIIAGTLYFFCLAYSNYAYNNSINDGSLELYWKYNLYGHLLAWIFQFIGHGVFEKRSPALMDNLFLTLVAPDFVILEILFEFGYKKSTYIQIKTKIHENINVFRSKKASVNLKSH